MSDDNVPVGSLLGAAYETVVHGQGLAAREAVELVRNLGFEKDGTAKPFRFAYQRTESTEAGPQVRTVHATVPLLSLVNPPTISIDSATISMSLQLISQDIQTATAYAASASGGTSAAEKTTPRLAGRIVHKNAETAVLTIESTLKQRDLLGSSRLSQLLDAAVSDRDSVWYQVLDQAEPFRTAASALTDAVDKDRSTVNGWGVHEWLQQVWQLRAAVTDAVSAFRDGTPEKIPQLHQRWNTVCDDLIWVKRQHEQEPMTQLRRTFLATARAVWNTLLPGEPVAEFGPPTVDQLRVRMETAVAALAAATPTLRDLPARLHQLEGAVAQACTAHKYGQLEDVAAEALNHYNATALEIRDMWDLFAQSPASRAAQDDLAEAAESVWGALVPSAEYLLDFRAVDRTSVEELDKECTRTLGTLDELAKQLFSGPGQSPLYIAHGFAKAGWSHIMSDWRARRTLVPATVQYVIAAHNKFNEEVSRANQIIHIYVRELQLQPDTWNPAAEAWNETAGQFWGNLNVIGRDLVTSLVSLKSL